MNSNATVREVGSERAAELSAVYDQVRNFTFDSVDHWKLQFKLQKFRYELL